VINIKATQWSLAEKKPQSERERNLVKGRTMKLKGQLQQKKWTTQRKSGEASRTTEEEEQTKAMRICANLGGKKGGFTNVKEAIFQKGKSKVGVKKAGCEGRGRGLKIARPPSEEKNMSKGGRIKKLKRSEEGKVFIV